MRFSRGVSFNTNDTSVRKCDNGRIQIDQTRGVKARCELTLNALLRFGPKGATAEMICGHINKRVKGNYTTSDVRYAMDRLVNEGVIGCTTFGKGEDSIYKAGQRALDHWRKLSKR